MEAKTEAKWQQLYVFTFLGFPDPNPALFYTDPNLHLSINKQKRKKNLDFYYSVTSF
jgi:hypothetical protein